MIVDHPLRVAGRHQTNTDVMQLNLLDRQRTKRPQTIQERFEEFHRANPHIYRGIEEYTLRLYRRDMERFGVVKRFGISPIIEALRYDHRLRTTSEDFKINNNYRALYVRMLIKHHPKLEPMFELRERRTP